MKQLKNTPGTQKAAAPAEKKPYFHVIATNRRARFDYHIEETYEAGIQLAGSEVKALRSGRVDFIDSYAHVRNGECWLESLKIPLYVMAHVDLPKDNRSRRLLLKHREIVKLEEKSGKSGYTLIPLELYFKGSWVKVKIGVGRGKKEYDKRQTIKSNEANREVARALKRGRR